MRQTLLEIVQEILSDMSSDEVNAISDSAEAMQVARIVQTVFYNITKNTEVPENGQLLTLTAASDSTTPTHFTIPENVRVLDKVWYSKDSTFDYYQLTYVDKFDFLERVDGVQDNYTNVTVEGTNLRIRNNKNPEFFTMFDDTTVICNSHDSAVDSTLQESKIRAYGYVIPTFSLTDSYVPDVDTTYFPLLVAEAKSTAMDLLKGATSNKIEQTVRRQRGKLRDDKTKIKTRKWISPYGRS